MNKIKEVRDFFEDAKDPVSIKEIKIETLAIFMNVSDRRSIRTGS